MTPEKALNIIAGMCSKKEYCSKAVLDKLSKWELEEKDIRQIMNFLYHHQFIDDNRYARIYAEDKFRFNHWGKQKINMMLRQKGISQEIITAALESVKSENYEATCLELLKQKMKNLSEEDPYKLKAKLIRFASSRGFGFDTINTCLQKLLKNDDEEYAEF